MGVLGPPQPTEPAAALCVALAAQIEVSEESELDSLMDSSEYGAHCDESAH